MVSVEYHADLKEVQSDAALAALLGAGQVACSKAEAPAATAKAGDALKAGKATLAKGTVDPHVVTPAIVLAAVGDGKVSLIAGVTADTTAKVKAGELVNFVAAQVGGKGGGRPDMAQAGGTQPDKLPEALASVAAWGGGRASTGAIEAMRANKVRAEDFSRPPGTVVSVRPRNARYASISAMR